MKTNMSKPKKTKAQNQKTVSKTAKDLGFKNIKEAKEFFNSNKASQKTKNLEAVGPEADASEPVASADYREINEEISRLMLDPYATDEYIVERTKYLISKYKQNKPSRAVETCREETSCCSSSPSKEAVEESVKFFLLPKFRYYNLFDNFTVTTSL